MSEANPRLVITATTTALAPFDFGTVAAGMESSEIAFDVLNDGAAAEDVTEVSIGVEWSDDGGATFTGDVLPASLERWLQVQVTDVAGTGIEAQVTPWTPVGSGARLVLKPIPANCRRVASCKLVAPPTISSDVLVAKLILYYREGYIPLGSGWNKAGIRGVEGGTGDPGYSGLLSGGALTQTGTPDGNVQIATLVAKVGGVPVVRYAGALAIAASASGKARQVTLSVAADGTVTATASAEVTAPSPITARPAVPAGEVLLGWIHRDDGTIATADIYPGQLYSPFGLTISGLNWTVGPGAGICDSREVWRDRTTTGTFADNDTTTLYVLPTSALQDVLSGGSPTSPRAEPLWAVTVASGAVTLVRDLRRFLGPELHTFAASVPGTVATGVFAYLTLPADKGGYVRLPAGCSISVATIGDRTTGVLRVALERWDGAAWTSLFSATAAEPQLAAGATALVAGGFTPDTAAIAAGTRLRWNTKAIPATGGTVDPTGLAVSVQIEMGA